jgi:hypothetical protein
VAFRIPRDKGSSQIHPKRCNFKAITRPWGVCWQSGLSSRVLVCKPEVPEFKLQDWKNKNKNKKKLWLAERLNGSIPA